jgi:hypothetical protein
VARFALVWLLASVALVGCGDAEHSSPARDGDYPLVAEDLPRFQPAVTEASGAVVRRPVKPSEYEATPSATCERILATFHDGSKPTRRPIVIPPRPGLRARAISLREVELAWSFSELPRDCRPTKLLLSIVANDAPSATPTNLGVDVDAASGTARIEYPDFLPPPDVAMASAYTRAGHRSRLAQVLIRHEG